MRMKYTFAKTISTLFVLIAAGSFAHAQTPSTALEYPTPLTSATVLGQIAARSVGDSRMTSHYYLFESGVGDINVNIEATNLNGDIDIYTAGTMRPLLKASVYSTDYATAIQRDFYLRLPSRLILRVQGRTPSDDPASYKLTFTGAFKPISAAAAAAMPRAPEPKVTATGDPNDGRFSATGAVIEKPKPKPTPTPKPASTPRPTPTSKRADVAKNTSAKETKPKVPSSSDNDEDDAEEARRKELARLEAARRDAERKDAARKRAEDAAKRAEEREAAAAAASAAKTGTAKKPAANAGTAEKPPPDAMAGVFLEIELKDGTRLRYAMPDVFTFSVDAGTVKIVLKNGRLITRRLADIEEIKIGK